MAIGWSAASTWSLISAWYIQASAGATWWPTVITLEIARVISGRTIPLDGGSITNLDFTNTAGITGLAQSRFWVHMLEWSAADLQT